MVRQNPGGKGVIGKILFLKGLWLNGKLGVGRSFFSYLFFNCSELSETKMPVFAGLFLRS